MGTGWEDCSNWKKRGWELREEDNWEGWDGNWKGGGW